MEQLNETQRYFIEEHVEDFRDGFISRRELIRRVTLIAGSAAAASTILAACDLSPRPATSSAVPTAAASPTASAALVAQPYATPPPAPVPDGVTVKESDPRITVSKPEVKGGDGGPQGGCPVLWSAARELHRHRQDEERRFGGLRGARHAHQRHSTADGGAAQESRRSVPDHRLSRGEPRLPQRHQRRSLQRGAGAEGLGRHDRVVPEVPGVAPW